MYNLISRDLILQKKSLLLYVAVVLFFIVMEKNPALIYIVASIFIPFNTYAYDEKVQTNILLNSLPYTRAEIISARYLGAIVYMILAITVTSLLLLLFGQSFTLNHMAIGSGLFLIFAALTFPLFYILKPGYITNVVLVSFLVLAFVGPAIFIYLAEKLTVITEFIFSLSELAIYMGATCSVIAVYGLSWLLTNTIYRKKAF